MWGENQAAIVVRDASAAVEALPDGTTVAEEWWGSVVRDRRGVRAAQNLDLVAPSSCASWLDALLALALVARSAIAVKFLSGAWLEIGLRFARWRARVAAVELLSSLAECDLDREKADAQVLEELLQSLVFRTGLCDSQWQIRRAVVPAATKLLTASQGLLPQPLEWCKLCLISLSLQF